MMPFRDRQNRHLNRRKPKRERACIVFNQHAKKSLERPCNGTMQHDRTVRLAISGNIFQLKPLRQIEIHLSSAALPPASDRIPDFEIHLGAIKSAAAFIHFITDLLPIEWGLQPCGRPIPDLLASYSLFGPGSDKRLDFFKTECVPERVGKIEQSLDFILQLLLR